MTAEEFLDLIERPRGKQPRADAAGARPSARVLDRDLPLSSDEAAFWLEEFGELEHTPEIREAFGTGRRS